MSMENVPKSTYLTNLVICDEIVGNSITVFADRVNEIDDPNQLHVNMSNKHVDNKHLYFDYKILKIQGYLRLRYNKEMIIWWLHYEASNDCIMIKSITTMNVLKFWPDKTFETKIIYSLQT